MLCSTLTSRRMLVESSRRCLTPSREAVRTVMELDGGRRSMMSEKKAKKSKAGMGGGGGLDQKTINMLKLLDAKPKPMPELTPEEKQRNFEIGRRYNSKMATAHNTRMADLSMKIKLRDDAIENLPELLQHAARQREQTPPPLNRRIATYTPPIPNFNPKDYDIKDDGDPDADLDRFRGGY